MLTDTIILDSVVAAQPIDHDPNAGALSPESPPTPCTAGASIICHARDGHWYCCDSLPPDCILSVQEMSPCAVNQWIQRHVPPVPKAPTQRYRFERLKGKWNIQYKNLSGNVKESRGLEYITRLLAKPHKSLSACDLMRLEESYLPGSSVQPPDVTEDDEIGQKRRVLKSGTRQEILDYEAVCQYKKRADELLEEIEEANANNNQAQSGKLQADLHFILSALEATHGKKGARKIFKSGDPSEKARMAVRQALKRAYQQIRKECPRLIPLADHLEKHIQTSGTTYGYCPEPNAPKWEIE